MKSADQLRTHAPEEHNPGAHDRDGWKKILCCIPMVVIAVALVATGVASAGFLFTAVVCVGMMAMMMRGMNHSGSAK